MAISRKRKHAVEAATQQSKQIPVELANKRAKTAATLRTTQEGPGMENKALEGVASQPTANRRRKRSVETISAVQENGQESKKIIPATPQHKRARLARPLSPAETPSRSTAKLFDQLRLRAGSPSLQAKQNALLDTPPATPESDRRVQDTCLPDALQELQLLYTAFLGALSLHYAHNGASSPVNMRELLPVITKVWRKRQTNMDDVRRVLTIASKSDASFVLEDFDRAGTCLIWLGASNSVGKHAGSYIDENGLNALFEEALRKAWTNWVDFNGDAEESANAFISQIQLLDVTKSESAEKTAPLFARGQQRLKDLRTGQAAARAEAQSARGVPLQAEEKQPEAVQSRGTSLLNRILAKQALTASLPAGPTKQDLERKAALHRIEDVTRVLEVLAAGRPRVSFSMQAVVQHLQQSLRNPISKEEVERCLGLMAGEIMPRFVSIISSGTVRGVVVTKGGKLGLADLKERLANAES